MAPRLPARTSTARCRSGACRTMRAATAVAQRVGGAGCAGPAAEGSDCADAAWRGAAPGARPGSWEQDRCDVWASSHPRLAIVTSRFPMVATVGRLRHRDPVSLFDRGTVSSSRPGSSGGTARGKGKAGRWRPPRPPSRRGYRTIDRSAASPSSRRQLPSQHPVGLAELSAVGLAPACWRRDRRCVLR